MQPPFRQRLGTGLLLLSVGLGCACRSIEGIQDGDVAWLVRHGRFAEAVEAARAGVEANPDDPQARRLLEGAQVAFILDRGRQEVFAGNHEEALDLFRSAARLDPTNEIVLDWTLKTRRQLASEWLDRATALTGPRQLHQAELALEKVLDYVPDHERGRAELARVLLLKNHRAGQSKTYFDDGVRTFRELFLRQAWRNFDVSYNYDRRNDRAKTRGGDVERLIAEERLAQAQNLEEAGLFHAARNEYRLVLLIDLSNEDAKAGLYRMDRETRVSRWLDEAEMHMRRGDHEKARDLLADAKVITSAQADRVRAMAEQIEESRLRGMYTRARTFEKDYLYPEAVATYGELLEVDPYYDDAPARKSTLEEFILLAEEYYAQALATESDQEAADILRQIPILWPEFRDVDARLREIEERLDADVFDGADEGAGE